MSYSVCFQTQ